MLHGEIHIGALKEFMEARDLEKGMKQEMLLDYATMNGLLLTNTCFKKRESNLTTFKSGTYNNLSKKKSGTYNNKIDFILT